MTPRLTHWSGAFVAVCMLHALPLLGLLGSAVPSPRPAATTPALLIGLGDDVIDQDGSASGDDLPMPVATTAPPALTPPPPAPTRAPAVAPPRPRATAAPAPAAVDSSTLASAVATAETPVSATEPPLPAAPPAAEPQPTATQNSSTAAAAEAGATSAAASGAESGSGPRRRQRGGGGEGRNALQAYFAEVSKRINANKEYPDALKKKKVDGTVTVRISIDATGQLISAEIQQSSGSSQLDQAALAAIAKASPFPQFPDPIDRPQLSIAVPIEYALIKD